MFGPTVLYALETPSAGSLSSPAGQVERQERIRSRDASLTGSNAASTRGTSVPARPDENSTVN